MLGYVIWRSIWKVMKVTNYFHVKRVKLSSYQGECYLVFCVLNHIYNSRDLESSSIYFLHHIFYSKIFKVEEKWRLLLNILCCSFEHCIKVNTYISIILVHCKTSLLHSDVELRLKFFSVDSFFKTFVVQRWSLNWILVGLFWVI